MLTPAGWGICPTRRGVLHADRYRHDDNPYPLGNPYAAAAAVAACRPAGRRRRLGDSGHHRRRVCLRRAGDPDTAPSALSLPVIVTGRTAIAVTTTAPSARITDLDRAPSPNVQGISHLGLTVVDLARAIDFWCTVMDFQVITQDEEFSMVWRPSARLAIGLSAPAGSATGPFDAHHVGLDHLALAVADSRTLRAWATRFTELSVPHSPITETDAGHHLNARAPRRHRHRALRHQGGIRQRCPRC